VKDILTRQVEKMKEVLILDDSAESEERNKREKELHAAEEKLLHIPESIEPERARIVGQHLVRILDTLWVEHLENLESLRDSVNIRAYGQHEPLVEYRREAHGLFKALNENFEGLVWNTIFPFFETDMEKITHTEKKEEKKVFANTKMSSEEKNIGRNDPCWCGSGKKYKKCHGK
jgi:preprotein translocase subunit SecA